MNVSASLRLLRQPRRPAGAATNMGCASCRPASAPRAVHHPPRDSSSLSRTWNHARQVWRVIDIRVALVREDFERVRSTAVCVHCAAGHVVRPRASGLELVAAG